MQKALILLLITASLNCYSQVANLTIEPNHSTIGFRVPIADGMTAITGKFTEYDLKMIYKDGDITKSEFQLTIEVASINTGIPDRDGDLQSAVFFEGEKYPQIQFKSTEVRKVDKSKYLMKGDLTMKGVTKSIELPFEVTGIDGNAIGVKIRSSLNRIDFGVGAEFEHTDIPNFIANDILLEIDFWTKRDKRLE